MAKKAKDPNKKLESIFLSGTDRVRDVQNDLYKALKGMGFKPLWYKAPDFPCLDHNNAMDNCLAVASTCDRMVVVIDERAGLRHPGLNITITEAEFEKAFERDIPILIFVRVRVHEQARVYHRHAAEIRLHGSGYFKGLKLDGDEEAYAFFERIQHKTRGGQPAVPWSVPFEVSDDILPHIREKWLLPARAQAAALDALRTAAVDPSKGNVSLPSGVEVRELVLQAIKGWPKKEREQLARKIDQMQSLIAMGKSDPRFMRAIKLSPRMTHYVLRLTDGLRVLVRVADENKLIISGLQQQQDGFKDDWKDVQE